MRLNVTSDNQDEYGDCSNNIYRGTDELYFEHQ